MSAKFSSSLPTMLTSATLATPSVSGAAPIGRHLLGDRDRERGRGRAMGSVQAGGSEVAHRKAGLGCGTASGCGSRCDSGKMSGLPDILGPDQRDRSRLA